MRAPDAITEMERDSFEALHEAFLAPIFDGPGPLLIRATLDGRDIAVVAALLGEGSAEDRVNVVPLAILINPDLMERVTPPDGAVRVLPTQ
jgi:hypothetical protein